MPKNACYYYWQRLYLELILHSFKGYSIHVFIYYLNNVSLFLYFQYGKESLEGRVRSRKYSSDEENSETESDRNGPSLRAGRSRPDISLTPEADKRPLSNGGTHVISRDDLILVPDPGQNINNNHLDIPVS